MSDEQALDDYQTALRLVQIIPAVMRIVAAELRRTRNPLEPTHLDVLNLLAQQPCNLSRLAELQAVSLPTMSNTISRMAQQGWVKRSRAPHDRRMVLLEITPAGQKLLEEIGGQVVTQIARLLQPLSTAEHLALWDGLDALQQAFTPVIKAEPGDSQSPYPDAATRQPHERLPD